MPKQGIIVVFHVLFFYLLLVLSHGVEASGTEYSNLRVICVACSSGIGRAAAESLLKGGASVVISSRSLDKLQQVAKPYPKTALPFACDAADKSQLESLANASKKFFNNKPVTTLIWAATSTDLGMSFIGSDKLIPFIENQMQLNVYSLLTMIDFIRDDLLQVGDIGSILGVSSISAQDPGIGAFPYSLAKAALDQTIKLLALEYGSYGVRVNSVLPATIDTPIFDIFGPAKEAMLKDFAYRHRLGRIGTPEECAEFMAFLVSDKAKFMTGQCIRIDGGNSLLGSHTDIFSPFMAIDPNDDRWFPLTRKWTKDGFFKDEKKKSEL